MGLSWAKQANEERWWLMPAQVAYELPDGIMEWDRRVMPEAYLGAGAQLTTWLAAHHQMMSRMMHQLA